MPSPGARSARGQARWIDPPRSHDDSSVKGGAPDQSARCADLMRGRLDRDRENTPAQLSFERDESRGCGTRHTCTGLGEDRSVRGAEKAGPLRNHGRTSVGTAPVECEISRASCAHHRHGDAAEVADHSHATDLRQGRIGGQLHPQCPGAGRSLGTRGTHDGAESTQGCCGRGPAGRWSRASRGECSSPACAHRSVWAY